LKVLDNGELLECDSPYALLNNPNSHLSLLVSQLGEVEFDYLRQMAKIAVEQNTASDSQATWL
jgi:hypothetical protein